MKSNSQNRLAKTAPLRSPAEPLPVDEQFEEDLETLLQEAAESGEPTEMTPQDWDDIRRQGSALIKARKSAP